MTRMGSQEKRKAVMMILSLIFVVMALGAAVWGMLDQSTAAMQVAKVFLLISTGFLLWSLRFLRKRKNQEALEQGSPVK